MKSVYFLLLIFFSVSLFPAFGAIDKANFQWLFLALIPLFFFKIYPRKLKFNNPILILYFFFVFQVFLSLIYSNNISISLVDLSRHVTLLLILLLLVYSYKNFSFNFFNISLLISSFLIIESIFSLLPVFSFIFNNGINFSNVTSVDINQFMGVAANRNITTASFVIKLPFIFYVLYKSKSFLKPLLSFFILFPLLALFLINSRSALLSFTLSIAFLVLYFIFINRSQIISLFWFLISIFISYYISILILPSKISNSIERIASIQITNESSSHRFFLWENALDFISNHLFIGCGIGNWKVESAAYWGSFGNSYLMPYHAHNDFLEFTTELGLLGGVTYLSLYLFILYSFIKSFLKSKDFKFVVLFLSFIALFIDSLLNFPFERPLIQVMFVLLLSLSIHFYPNLNEEKL